jgi:hypothetical protein
MLYAALVANPLLKFRVFELNKALSSGKHTDELITAHRTRVLWQIRRIYRSRNLMVHAGQKLSFLPRLVENLHYYFHFLLDGLEDMCGRQLGRSSLQAAMLLMRIEDKAHMEYLEINAEKAASVETVVEFIGGPVLNHEIQSAKNDSRADPLDRLWKRWEEHRPSRVGRRRV